MARFLLAVLFILFASQSFAQNYKAEFASLFKGKDTAGQLKLLQQWQKASPKDAELFISWFNYYFFTGREEVVQLADTTPEAEALELKDSTGEPTVYLSEVYDYDSTMLAQAFLYIDSGIKAWPARLDMRFGKIYALGQVEDYEAYTNEIIKTLEAGSRLKHQWVWAGNKKVEDAEHFMLGAIQDYVVQLFNEGDHQLNRMRRIAQAVLKYYPKHVESLSNLAITYGLQGDYDHALQSLLQAEQIMPRDVIVLNNIATMYEKKGDKLNAIKYFELTARHGDKGAKDAAVKKLNELKN